MIRGSSIRAGSWTNSPLAVATTTVESFARAAVLEPSGKLPTSEVASAIAIKGDAPETPPLNNETKKTPLAAHLVTLKGNLRTYQDTA